MPDHVHAMIQFSENLPMIRAVRAWKSWTAKHYGITWQSQWFEHHLRDTESWREKSAYIRNNPVRAGLVEDAKDWTWFYARER
jgi:REP element-mobilizing transposase RayT